MELSDAASGQKEFAISLYLRQLVLAVVDLDRVLDDACAIFDTKQAHTDPDVGEFGARNAVFALGNQYIELVSPASDSAPVARFLSRRGEGLYAVMLQCDDDRGYRQTAQMLGIRTILELERGDYRCRQLHPVDAGLPVILEIDQQPGAPDGPYYPAGNVVPECGAANRARIMGVELPAPVPHEMARRWQRLLNLGPAPDPEVILANSALWFGASEWPGVTVHVAMADREAVLEAAGDRAVGPDSFCLGGIRFRLSEA